MSELDLKVRITADGGQLKAELLNAQGETRKFGTTAREAGNVAAGGFGRARTALESVSTQLSRARQQFLLFVGGRELVNYARQIISLADGYTLTNARLKLVTTSTAEFKTAQAELFAIAQRTASSLNETNNLYIKLAESVRELGGSQAEALQLTESINQATRLSGASAATAAAGLLQLGQALGSGVLRGDEFNSIMENSRRVARALADGLNVPIGKLRAMAEEGELTADVVIKALLSQKDVLEREYAQLPLTVGAAFEQLRTAVQKYIGQANEAKGITASLASAIEGLTKNFNVLADTLITVAQVALVAFVTHKLRVIAATTAFTGALGALRTAMSGVMALNFTSILFTAGAALSRLSTGAGLAAGALAGVRGVIGLLGGPISALITLLGTAAAAWFAFGNKAEEAGAKIESASDFRARLESLTDSTRTNLDFEAFRPEIDDQAAQYTGKLQAVAAIEARQREVGSGLGARGIAADLRQARADADELRARLMLATKAYGDVAQSAVAAGAVGSKAAKELTKDQAMLLDSLYPVQAAYREYNEDVAQLTQLQGAGVNVTEALNLRYKALQDDLKKLADSNGEAAKATKALEAAQRAQREEAEAVIKLDEENRAAIEAIEFETSVMGLSNAEREKAIALRAMELRGIQAGTQAYEDFARQLNDAINNRETKRAAKEAAEIHQREWEKTVENIDRTFHDGFVRMLEGGKDSWRAFTGSLRNTFKSAVADQLYKMLLQPFVVRVAGVFTGMLGASAPATAAGQTATSGGTGGITSIPGTGTLAQLGGGYGGAFLGAAGGAMYGYQQGGVRGATIGGVAGYVGGAALTSGAAAMAAGWGGAASGGAALAGASSALAAIPVWGWAALAALAVFGSGKAKPSNKSAWGAINLDTGATSSFGNMTGNKFSQETVDARNSFFDAIKTFSTALQDLTGGKLSGTTRADIGQRDGTQVSGVGAGRYSNPQEAFQAIINAMLGSLTGVSREMQGVLSKIDTKNLEQAVNDLKFASDFLSGNLLNPKRISEAEVALNALNGQFDSFRQTAQRLGLDVSEVNNAWRKQRAELLGEITKPLSDTISRIAFAEQSPLQQFNSLKNDFTAKGAGLDKLDFSALLTQADSLNALAEPLLALGKDVFASGPQFQTLLDTVIGTLDRAQDMIVAKAPTGSHATGLPYVPYDGYIGELHRGEAVIDAGTMQGLRRYGIAAQGASDNRVAEILARIEALLRESDQPIAIRVLTTDGRILTEQTLRELKRRSARGEIMVHAEGVRT